MAKFTIFSVTGDSIRCEGYPKYVGSYLKPSYIEFAEICSPTPIDWQVGDYVDYFRTGFRYKLYSVPLATKKGKKMASGDSFVYKNVQLYAATKDLEIALFRDIVENDNGIHFSTSPDVSTFENVSGIAKRIQACMDDVFPGRWEIRVASIDDESVSAMMEETKQFSLNNGSCLSALEQVYQTWKNVGWTHTHENGKEILTIGKNVVRTDDNTTEAFAYGRRKGLSSLRKADANKDGFATRLYVYGSDRNIQTRYYNELDIYNAESVDIRNLMIPPEHWGKTDGKPDARKAYLQADDSIIAKYGLIPRQVYFNGGENEDIFPSIKGIKSNELRKLMIESGLGGSYYLPLDTDQRIDKIFSAYGWGIGNKEETDAEPNFYLFTEQVGFNIAEQGKQTAEGFATISFLSGACAGRDFKVKTFSLAENGKTKLLMEKIWDESIGMAFPNNFYPISEGDEFVILDIPMPEFYITLAQNKLYSKAQQLLADYTKVSAFYEPEIDPIMVKEKGATLKEGMFMQVMDEDVVDNNTDYVLIDTINIDESGVLPTYKVTLREQKRSVSTFSSLQEMIEDAKYDSKADIKKERQYVERRFSTAQETLDMLQEAIGGFGAAVSPITLQTMAILVGSQSLQFTFIKSLSDTAQETPSFTYSPATKRFTVPKSILMHYTIGQNEISTAHNSSSLSKWEIKAFQSGDLLDDNKAYYLYAFVPNSGIGEFILSDVTKEFKIDGGYNLLVGILNSSVNGTRDFAPLYGFTEVLPGQITTDVIRSADGKTYFDLANSEIGGRITFASGSSGLKNLSEWSGVQSQIDKANEDALKAQNLADEAKADAEKAAQDAEQAASDAKNASDRLNDWASDELVSPSDIPAIENELVYITADKTDIDAQLEIYAIDNEDTISDNFNTAYNAYEDALNAVLKLEIGTTFPEDLDDKQTAYYTQRTIILEAIAKAAKKVADDAQKTADDANAEAGEAAKTAEEAKENAEDALLAAQNAEAASQEAQQVAAAAQAKANEVSEKIDGDNYFTEIEKKTIRSIIAEITECKEQLYERSALVKFTAKQGNAWYKVDEDSKAEWTDANEDDHSVSQSKYAGYYSSNMHTANGVAVMQVDVELTEGREVNIQLDYVSDAESTYDWMTVGVRGLSVVPTSTTTSSNSTANAAGSTYGKQRTVFSKVYNMTQDVDEEKRYFQVAYKKNATTDIDTDSAYFRINNPHFIDNGGNLRIVELKGSFHRYYLLLMQKGYTDVAEMLYDELDSVIVLLNDNGLWTSGTTELADGADFRTKLNQYLTNYYAILASCGFDIMDSKLSDFDYLAGALKDGSKTITDGGLIMTSLVAVGDTSTTNADVEAFMNGSDFAEDSEHGKLLLAGGIPTTVVENGTEYSDLEKRAKEAATKIYEDGYMKTRLLELLDGCKIGDIEIVSGGLKVTLADGGTSSELNLWSGGLLSSAMGGTASLGASASGAIQAYSKSAEMSSPSGINAAVIAEGTRSEFAFYSRNGKFAGLRPNIQTISSGSTLNETQHTLIIASGTLLLPNDPKDGQEYKVIHTSTTSLQIRNTSTSNINIFDFKNAVAKSYTVTSNVKETIELVYNAADSTWYANKY